jgi:hypothetical protein
MSTTTRRSTARALAVVAAVPLALTVSALPAAAVPDEGEPPTSTAAIVPWGWPSGDGPAYPGQRFGRYLPPELRGNVLEFMDR